MYFLGQPVTQKTETGSSARVTQQAHYLFLFFVTAEKANCQPPQQDNTFLSSICLLQASRTQNRAAEQQQE
jgi:hypothetical protein